MQHILSTVIWRQRERDVLFNNALNTFYLLLYGVRHMVKDHSDSERERERKECYFTDKEGKGEREMFYLTTHSTHFIYGYMASDIWLRTILIVSERERKECYFTDKEGKGEREKCFI